MMSIDITSTAISNICGVDHRCIIIGITKSEVIYLLQNVNFIGKCGLL